MTADEFRADSQRQSQELYALVSDAVQAYAAHQERPSLSALAGALAGALGQCLATIQDPKHRAALRRSVDAALSDYELGEGFGKVQVHVLAGKH